MPRPDETPITFDGHGDETHPSFGKILVSRISGLTNLFDSSHPHREWVRLRITPATRHRDLHTDRIHPRETRSVIEVDMSLAQWADMVSSFGSGSGTSVTIAARDGQVVPRASNDEGRLAVTSREVANAAKESTEKIREAVAAVQHGFNDKVGRREMATLIGNLVSTAGNVPSNMKFAADRLTEHAEKVVTKAKADIEASMLRAAQDRQLDVRTTVNELLA